MVPSPTACSQVVSQLGRDLWLKGSIWFHDLWLAPPNKDIDKNRETANIGLDSSVGRAPACQSGGRRFKSCFSKFFFVYPNLSKICTQSVSLVVYYMIFI